MSPRIKTKYPGVYYRTAQRIGGSGSEKVFYIVFKRDGRTIEEKVGRQFKDDMTAAKANIIRGDRIEGKRKSRKELRMEEEARRAETLGAMWEAFKEAKRDNRSIRTDINRWNAYLDKEFASKPASELITLDIDRLRRNLTKKGLAPATVWQALALLKRIVRFGVKRGLCRQLDSSKLHFEMPKVNNIKTEDLTTDQLKKLLKAIEDDPNRHTANMMMLVLYTGMRRGELFRLQWKHIDFQRGFIRLVAPKGGKDQSIPLNDAARKLLKAHERTGSPYVFPGLNGGPRKDVKSAVARIKKNAQLPKGFRPFHGLRHVYASTLASSGKVDMYTLQKLLTHKNPQMTQRYAHLRDDALAKAAEVASEAFGDMKNEGERKVIKMEGHKGEF
ncbi:site-specific integrase [Pseudodesulfovibrio indicus]|uniref:tyrosine-type recombinase/integrase n=1 Tax=Pseudodesulfovibrio indicus TaxID=1716143 RepID=UPI00292E56E9|nr:site-specific integrase [Pseudodesulfovibrio indicus]